MNPIHHLRLTSRSAVLGALAAALVVSGAAPAFASGSPTPGPADYITPGAEPPGWHPPGPAIGPVVKVPGHTVITGGMPGWQITLIAIGAALLAAVLAVLADRMWAGRRREMAGTA